MEGSIFRRAYLLYLKSTIILHFTEIVYDDVIRVHLVRYVAWRRAFVKRSKIIFKSRLQGIFQPFGLTLCKFKFVLVDAMKGCMVGRDIIAPLILNFDSRWS